MGRKAPNLPPIYPKKPKVGDRKFARIYVAGKPQDFPLGPHGSEEAKQAYLRLAAEIAANGGLPPAAKTGNLTVDEVLARFWTYAEAEYDPRGRELENFRLSLAPLRRLYGSTPAARFDSECLIVVQQAMVSGSWMSPEEKAEAAKRKRSIGWCRNVVNRRIVRIKTAWKWAEAHKLVPPGSYHHLQTVRGLTKRAKGVRQTTPRGPSTREQIDAVLPHCPRPVAAMLEIQWIAGTRSCEIRILRTADVDRSGDIWLYRPSQHKSDWRETDQGRVIPLGPECQRILAPWLRPDDPERYAFASHRTRNTCYTSMTYAQAVRRACTKAGVKLTAYEGRHAAKRRIARAAGVEAARTVLGHKSVETTELYGGMDTELAKQTMRECG